MANPEYFFKRLVAHQEFLTSYAKLINARPENTIVIKITPTQMGSELSEQLFEFAKVHKFKKIGHEGLIRIEKIFLFPQLINISPTCILLIYDSVIIKHDLDSIDKDGLFEISEFVSSLVSILKHDYEILAFNYAQQTACFSAKNSFEIDSKNNFDSGWVNKVVGVFRVIYTEANNTNNTAGYADKKRGPIKRLFSKKKAIMYAPVILLILVISIIGYKYKNRESENGKRDSYKSIIDSFPDNSPSDYVVSKLPPASDVSPNIDNGRNIALVIGIGQYSGDWVTLPDCVNDAKQIGDILHKKYGFTTIALYDTNATRGKIIDILQFFVDSLKDNDNLLIYYAGHGDIHDGEYRASCWVPQDAKTHDDKYMIQRSQIINYLYSIIGKGKACHILLICDNCFDGDLVNTGIPVKLGDYTHEYNNKSATIISSAIDVKQVIDYGGKPGHSAFESVLYKALSDNKQPYYDELELFAKLWKDSREDQKPGIRKLYLKNLNLNNQQPGGAFVFVNSKKGS